MTVQMERLSSAFTVLLENLRNDNYGAPGRSERASHAVQTGRELAQKAQDGFDECGPGCGRADC